jgi:uroporphyrinogen-III synthase
LKIKKVLVSQPEPNNPKSPYFDLAKKYNLKIDFKPFNRIEGVSSKDFRQQKINILDYSAVVFTSKTGIDHFFRICNELRICVPDSMKYFCITENVSFYLQKYIVYIKRNIFHGRAKSLKENFPEFNQGDIKIAAFGPTTISAVKKEGLRVDINAPNVNAPSMTMALDNYLKEYNRNLK